MTDITDAIAREIAMGREANQSDRITAAKIIEIFKRWDIGEAIQPAQTRKASRKL